MMNEILIAIEERRSIRKYKDEKPAADLVQQVVDAGLWAASGMGQQETRLIVVKNKDLRNELSELNRQIGGWKEGFDPFYGAPMVVVVLGKKGRGVASYDGSLVMANMMLAAHSVGLASCWIHRAKETYETEAGRKLLENFGLDADNWEGVANLILGYADGDAPKAAPRKVNRVITVE